MNPSFWCWRWTQNLANNSVAAKREAQPKRRSQKSFIPMVFFDYTLLPYRLLKKGDLAPIQKRGPSPKDPIFSGFFFLLLSFWRVYIYPWSLIRHSPWKILPDPKGESSFQLHPFYQVLCHVKLLSRVKVGCKIIKGFRSQTIAVLRWDLGKITDPCRMVDFNGKCG